MGSDTFWSLVSLTSAVPLLTVSMTGAGNKATMSVASKNTDTLESGFDDDEVFRFSVFTISGESLGTCAFLRNDGLSVVKWQLYVALRLDERGIQGCNDFSVVANDSLFTICHTIGDFVVGEGKRLTVVFAEENLVQ